MQNRMGDKSRKCLATALGCFALWAPAHAQNNCAELSSHINRLRQNVAVNRPGFVGGSNL
jgi:hypothetical protein